MWKFELAFRGQDETNNKCTSGTIQMKFSEYAVIWLLSVLFFSGFLNIFYINHLSWAANEFRSTMTKSKWLKLGTSSIFILILFKFYIQFLQNFPGLKFICINLYIKFTSLSKICRRSKQLRIIRTNHHYRLTLIDYFFLPRYINFRQ